jgi:macrolide transport system ATP-binding/permease protein
MVRLIYRYLLVALPTTARARIGDDLIDTLVADVRAATPIAAVGRFFANAVDLVKSGLAERQGARNGRQRVPVSFRGGLNDARIAVRSFAKAPGFFAVAILSIAVGIGLNTTIFSVVNAVVLRPVPGADPDRLVAVFTSADGMTYSSSSYPDFADLARENATLDGLMAHTMMFAGVERGESTSITVGEIVSPNYFDVLGVRLAAGAGFQPGAERADAPPTAVISHRMWQRDFGGRADAIGRDLTIRGRKYVITGVAPAGFNGLAAGVSAELWVPSGVVNDVEPVGLNDVVPSPTGTSRNEQRGQRYLFLTGRLKPGVTIDQARANIQTLMAGLERAYPQTNRNRTPTVVAASSVRIHPDLDRALRPSAAILMGAVGLVLLIACSNIASLLLARATSRAREIALRVAIGASRWQIVRQLVIESVVLSLIGGAVGLVLALWLAGVLSRIQPPMQVSIAFDFSPDLRVFAFTFGLALVTGVIFGLAPALRASRPNLVPALKGDAELTRTRRVSMRAALVAGQMALSMVLLVVAGLLLRSFAAASMADVGFDADRIVYAAVNSSKQFADTAAATRFFEEAERRLRALPGVTAVARTDRLPFALTGNTSVVEIPGQRGPVDGGGFVVDVTNVSADYFAALGIPIVRGRAIDARDRGADSLKVAVINETAARRFFPGQDPIGAVFTSRNDAKYTIVGVSKDHPVRAVGEAPRPFFQFAIDQTRTGFANLVVRSNEAATELTPLVRRELLGIEPRLAFLGLEPMTATIDATLFPARAAVVLLGSFSALALLLAIIGLYGVVSFTVARQTRDIGIRVALGADRRRVIGDVLRQSGTLVMTGGVIGLMLAAGAAQVLSGFLVGISALDPVTYVAATLVLAASAVIASIVPARRAATVDPLTALRST